MTRSNGLAPALQQFGFLSERGGPHLARTMMLGDLAVLLNDGRIEQSRDSLVSAIEKENILSKRSAQSRKLAARHLGKLYTLDRDVPLYRIFVFLWQREPSGRPLLAFLVSFARDAVLRSSAPFIFNLQDGEPYHRESLESFIDQLDPGRFSSATLKSTAQNLAGTWTQAGHRRGRVKKHRCIVKPTPSAVAMALLLSFVRGDRGQLLFESEYLKLLDCSASQGMELAETAANKGWINFKRVGSIMEVAFPRLLTQKEREWLVE